MLRKETASAIFISQIWLFIMYVNAIGTPMMLLGDAILFNWGILAKSGLPSLLYFSLTFVAFGCSIAVIVHHWNRTGKAYVWSVAFISVQFIASVAKVFLEPPRIALLISYALVWLLLGAIAWRFWANEALHKEL